MCKARKSKGSEKRSPKAWQLHPSLPGTSTIVWLSPSNRYQKRRRPSKLLAIQRTDSFPVDESAWLKEPSGHHTKACISSKAGNVTGNVLGGKDNQRFIRDKDRGKNSSREASQWITNTSETAVRERWLPTHTHLGLPEVSDTQPRSEDEKTGILAPTVTDTLWPQSSHA